MLNTAKSRYLLLHILVGLVGSVAFAQPAQDDGEVIERYDQSSVEGGWVLERQFSRDEIQKTCKEFEGEFISYYGRVFRVENCRRREVIDNDRIISLSKLGKTIREVPSEVIAQLESGKPVAPNLPIRGCDDFEGKYVTFNYVDVYLVEACRKRLFPDWASVEVHQKGSKRFGMPFLEMSPTEFYKMRAGKPMPSVIDKEFAGLLKGEAQVDVIPADEACQDLAGKIVSFYSRLYKIEKCRKREYDPELLLRSVKGKLDYKVLTAQQWLSIPDGEPMVIAK